MKYNHYFNGCIISTFFENYTFIIPLCTTYPIVVMPYCLSDDGYGTYKNLYSKKYELDFLKAMPICCVEYSGLWKYIKHCISDNVAN